MFKLLVFNSNGSVKELMFKTETKKVVLAKYRQLQSEGSIEEYIVVDSNGKPDLGAY